MTELDPMSEKLDCGGDAAAYVLGALDAAEAEMFRAHMADCVVCRDEVAAFQQVADALPMAAPQHAAPRGLRRRVLRDVRAEPRPARGAAQARGSRAGWGASLARPALAAGMAVAAAVAIVGGIELASTGSGGPRVIQASVTGLPGSAQLRVTGGHAELIVRHLPAPPAGHIYEVWLRRPNHAPAPTSALFSVTSTGAGDVGVPGDLRGVSEVLVTPERAGGSLVPTHAPVIVARLS